MAWHKANSVISHRPVEVCQPVPGVEVTVLLDKVTDLWWWYVYEDHKLTASGWSWLQDSAKAAALDALRKART